MGAIKRMIDGRYIAEKVGRFIGDLLELGCCLVFCAVYLFIHAVILLFLLTLITK